MTTTSETGGMTVDKESTNSAEWRTRIITTLRDQSRARQLTSCVRSRSRGQSEARVSHEESMGLQRDRITSVQLADSMSFSSRGGGGGCSPSTLLALSACVR